MAKKDNTLLWVAALGIGGYLYYKHKQGQAAPANATAPAVQTTDAKPVVLLPPATNLNKNIPVNLSNMTNAPSTVAIDTTGLVESDIDKNNNPVLGPGQTLALYPNGQPIVSASGRPLVFPGAIIKQNLQMAKMMGTDDEGCEIL